MAIEISITLKNSDDAAASLRDIARQIEDGFTLGFYPVWELTEKVDIPA